MIKRPKTQLLLLAAAPLLLAACSGDDSADSESAPQDTLVFARGGDAVSLDPSEVTDNESENVAQSILETLTAFEEGGTDTEPMLASGWEESDDGLTYTFSLQPGVTFHDGTDFDAEAVVFNFERWMDGSGDSFPMYGTVFGGYAGDESHNVEAVTAVDESTVELQLKRPQPTLLKDLALTPLSISSPAAIEQHGDNYRSNPVGTGPFVFKEWQANERIVLEKNEEYWVDGLPKLEQVIFRTIPDNSARFNALLSGEVDLVAGLDSENYSQVEEDAELELFSRPPLNLGYLGMTLTHEPLGDPLVRQALSHAVNKDAMVEAFFGEGAIAAKNAIPPAVEGYNDDIEPYAYDPERAKELLAEAGLPDGFDMELYAMPVSRPYMPDGAKVAEYLQSNFADIGVNAEIVSFEWATYIEQALNGEAQTFLLGWTGMNGDADNFIHTLLHGDNIGATNSTQYNNPELNALLDQARIITDQEERNELYREAQVILHEDPPIIPLVHTSPALAGRENITGFDPHPTGRVMTAEIEFEQ